MVAERGTGHDTVAETVQVEGARILATLIRTVGDLQIAEDAVQEATLAALHAARRDAEKLGAARSSRGLVEGVAGGRVPRAAADAVPITAKPTTYNCASADA